MFQLMPDLYPLSGNTLRTVSDAVFKAIDIADVEMFQTLKSFWSERLTAAFNNDSLEHFESLSYLLPNTYEHALEKLRNSASSKEIYENCFQAAVLDTKFRIGFPFTAYNEVLPFEDKEKYNRYSKIMLNRFADIFYNALRYKDLSKLPYLLKQLQLVRHPSHSAIISLIYELQKARKNNSEAEVITQLEKTIQVEGFIDETVRLLYKTVLFWTFFLYSQKVYDIDELQQVLEMYKDYTGYIRMFLAEDMVLLRSFRSENEYSWGRWNYIEREGSVSPPSIPAWTTEGMLFYLLRNNESFRIENQPYTTELIQGYESMATAMLGYLEKLEKSEYEIYGPVVGAKDKDNYFERIKRLRREASAVKKKAIRMREELLSRLPLETEYINNVRKMICDGWSEKNTINELFLHFDRIKTTDEIPKGTEIPRMGHKNTVWPGMKSSFVKDPQFYIPHFGTDAHGKEIAKWEESHFISAIRDPDPIHSIDIFAGINAAIEKLKTNEYTATVILMDIHDWYDHVNNSDNKYLRFIKDDDSKTFTDLAGYYKEIPVIKMRGSFQKNTVVVADFRQAFSLLRKRFDGACKGFLVNTIEPISPEKADSMILQNPKEWVGNMDREDAKLHLVNSLIVNIYVQEKFMVDIPGATVTVVLVEEIQEEEG
jgi:hypothetical protein